MAVLNTKLPGNLTLYPNSFKRQGAFPLEAYSVFYAVQADAENGIQAQTALQAAQDYATNSGLAYVGQILSVVNVVGETVTVDVYKIDNVAGDLSLVGDQEGLDAATASIAGLLERMGVAEKDITDIKAILNGDNGLVKTVEALGEAVEKAQGDATKALEDASKAQDAADKAQKDATDALAFESRISVLEAKEHVTSEQVATAKSEAIADAKTETEKQINDLLKAYITDDAKVQATDEDGNPLFEEDGVTPIYLPDAVDKLQEIAAWIADDTAGASKIIKDVKAIQDDYLKSADATAINKTITETDEKLTQAIDDLEALVGALPEGATSETVVAYITEVVDSLKIGDYAKAKDLTDLADRVTALDKEGGRIALIETDVSANTAEISDLKKAVGTIETGNNIADMLKNKVDKEEGSRLINATEIAILSKLNLNNGQVEIGGTVAAGSVTGLPQRIADILASTADGEGKLLEGKVETRHIADGAVTDAKLSSDLVAKIVNSVKQIKVGSANAVSANGTLAFSDEFKMEDGTIAMNSLNVNKLVQDENDWLILFGGDATTV